MLFELVVKSIFLNVDRLLYYVLEDCMKKFVPNLKVLIPFGAFMLCAGIFTFSVNADSTITIPVPKDYPNRKVTLSLRIPTQTEPLTRKEQMKPAIANNRIYVWDSNPCPKLSNDDEIHAIFDNFKKNGWITGSIHRTQVNLRPMEKYYAIRVVMHIYENIMKLGKAKNFNNAIKKAKLTASDVEDLRRMIKRFSKELVLFTAKPTKMDKDLLIIQEHLKKDTSGMLKVIKVEGTEDGATIIHMTVD